MLPPASAHSPTEGQVQRGTIRAGSDLSYSDGEIAVRSCRPSSTVGIPWPEGWSSRPPATTKRHPSVSEESICHRALACSPTGGCADDHAKPLCRFTGNRISRFGGAPPPSIALPVQVSTFLRRSRAVRNPSNGNPRSLRAPVLRLGPNRSRNFPKISFTHPSDPSTSPSWK